MLADDLTTTTTGPAELVRWYDLGRPAPLAVRVEHLRAAGRTDREIAARLGVPPRRMTRVAGPGDYAPQPFATTDHVVDHVAFHPGLTVRQLADRLGTRDLGDHLADLVERGAIVCVKEGRGPAVRVYAPEHDAPDGERHEPGAGRPTTTDAAGVLLGAEGADVSAEAVAAVLDVERRWALWALRDLFGRGLASRTRCGHQWRYALAPDVAGEVSAMLADAKARAVIRGIDGTVANVARHVTGTVRATEALVREIVDAERRVRGDAVAPVIDAIDTQIAALRLARGRLVGLGGAL